jgi:hypothetical protein
VLKKMTFMLVTALAVNSWASDHWDYCLSAGGDVEIEYGELVNFNSQIYPDARLIQVVKKIDIKRTTETCQLENSKQNVTSISEATSFQTIQLKTANGFADVDLICNVGGSGIPANDSCDEMTALKTVEYLVK